MVYIESATAEIRRGKMMMKKKIVTTAAAMKDLHEYENIRGPLNGTNNLQ